MIDINTLTIGSHVLFNGERVEISSIDLTDTLAPFVAFCGSGKFHHCSELQPIPITEELLTELGFEEIAEDDKNRKSFFHSNIRLGLMLFSDGQCYVSNITNSIVVRYLHQLEAFIRLTCGVSLT